MQEIHQVDAIEHESLLLKHTKQNKIETLTLREKSPYSEFFWSVFFRIRTKYGGIRRISPYLVQMRKKTAQENSEYGHFLLLVLLVLTYHLLWKVFIRYFAKQKNEVCFTSPSKSSISE